MAKELPFFKFEPGQWENGSIQMATLEQQGAFINICSIYWQRLGDLPYKLALQKACAGNATALDSLCDEQIIKVIDGMICIDFLNEQLAEFENTSSKNAENARLGWEKRRNKATAMRPHSDPNAIRGEEIREDERKPAQKFSSEDYYSSRAEAFEAIKLNDQFIEESTRTLSGRGWRTVEPLDVIASLKQFLNGKADLNTTKKNIQQHFKNWIIREKLENLQTYSQVFKTSLNGTGSAR